MALKSRVLNPLNNTRPSQQNLETDENKRVMPTWTPPGVVFPIMWILVIGPIRAATTAMVYGMTGSYASAAILSSVNLIRAFSGLFLAYLMLLQ